MNHREMKTLAENPDAVRSLAGYLLKLPAIDPQIVWTDWELDFLEHMALHEGPEPLTLRQVEVMSELKEAAQTFEKVGGLVIGRLIDECWQARLDLDEENEMFIVALKASGASSLKRRQVLRLLGCARKLPGIVEGYVGIP